MIKLVPVKLSVFFAACLACWLLQAYAGLSAVAAAALTGFCATWIPAPAGVERKAFQAVAYVGAFAGMCSRRILGGPLDILLISLLGTAFYFLLRSRFQGFGGRLGLMAFATSLLFLLVRSFR